MKARIKKLLAHGGRTLAVLLTFGASAVVGLSLHGNLPATRRLAAKITNDALADVFEGKLVVEDVRSLSIGRTASAKIDRVTVWGDEGRPVIRARGVSADIRLDRLLEALARGAAPDVRIGDARVDDAEVVLDRDGGGKLGIARAFHPKPKQATEGKTAPVRDTAKREELSLLIEHAFVGHAWVHGNVAPPALDGDASDVRARLAIAHDVFTLDLEGGRTTLRSPRVPSQIGDVHGDVKGQLTVPLGSGLLTGFGDLDGDVGIPALPIVAHAAITDSSTVDAKLDVARAEPSAVAKVFPFIQLTRPVELHAKADGKLPAIGLHVVSKSESSEVKADGEIDLREGHAFRLDVDATHVDAALVGGPKSDLSGRAHAEGNLDVAPSGTFKLTSTDGSLGDEHVPAVVAEGRLEEGKLTSTVRAAEPGVDATAKIDVAKNDLAFDLQARSYDLAKLARAPRVASGAASMRAIGHIDLSTRTIRARASANGDALASGPIAAAHARAEADVSGPVVAPVIDVTATGTDVRLTSPGKEPLVYPKANGRARVTLVPRPQLVDAQLEVARPGEHDSVVARAESIVLAPGGGVVVRGGRVTGLGAPMEADVDVSGPRWTIRAKGEDVDLERASTLTGIAQLKLLAEGGRANVDIDVTSDGRGARGHADVTVHARAGAQAEAHVAFAGRHVSARGRADLAGLGFVEVPMAELDLDGPPSAATVARATGFVDLRGSIDLSQVGVPWEDVEQLSGRATLEAHIERWDPHTLPAVRATVETHDLEVALAGSAPIRGIDARAHAAWDGRSEDVELAFMTWDGHGVLASGDAKARLPLLALVQGNRRTFFDVLRTASLSGIVDVPSRKIDDLPVLLVPHVYGGRVDARAELSGVLTAPEIVFAGHARGLRERGVPTGRERYEPIDGVVQAHWDGHDLVAVLSADERDPSKRTNRPTLRAPVGARDRNREPARDRARGRIRAMIVGRVSGHDLFLAMRDGKAPPLTADAEVEVEDLELSPIPLKSRVRGAVTGRVTLQDLGGVPSVTGRAHVDRFALSGARVDALDLDLAARDGSLVASAHAIDAGKNTLDVAIDSRALQWKGVAAGWDAEKRTRVEYRAANLRLSLFRSFVRSTLADLDGRLDGTGSAVFDAKNQTFDGQLALSDGRLYVNTLGEDITDVNAVVRFERNGVFRIEDATGKVEQGEFRASATGRMSGLSFVGASATVIVPPSKNGVPLSSEGVSFAEATGEIHIEAKMSDDRKALLVSVDVPRAQIELPRRATPNLQPLEADGAINTGVRKKDGTLDPITLDRKPPRTPDEIKTQFNVSLADDVYLDGNGLHIQLKGKTLVMIADEVKVTGRIDLRRGTITTQGRSFTVDEGSVTFPEGGDAGNPTVVASAYWDAPDRTRIWVEFKGPLKTGKLTLRSEPAFSRNEIFSILLFGRPDPNMAVEGKAVDQESQATAVASGFAAADLTRALAQLDENLQVETDTLSGNRTRTKVGYRVARNLRVELGYAAGNATYREPDTTFAFLDWQFLPKLSLLATQGNRGTSILDVLFQHRY